MLITLLELCELVLTKFQLPFTRLMVPELVNAPKGGFECVAKVPEAFWFTMAPTWLLKGTENCSAAPTPILKTAPLEFWMLNVDGVVVVTTPPFQLIVPLLVSTLFKV
ncbi:MAG: hypothetical protein WAT74_17840, partial [Flavobacteriales bacterium]